MSAGQALPTIPRRRRWWIWLVAIVILAAVGLAALLLYEPIKVRYLGHRVTNASTPEEELAAFGLVNHWTYGYAVRFRDKGGQDMGPSWTSGFAYEDIGYVEIEWRCGYRVKRKLLCKDNLIVLMGE